jgi:hypothetical protein
LIAKTIPVYKNKGDRSEMCSLWISQRLKFAFLKLEVEPVKAPATTFPYNK